MIIIIMMMMIQQNWKKWNQKQKKNDNRMIMIMFNQSISQKKIIRIEMYCVCVCVLSHLSFFSIFLRFKNSSFGCCFIVIVTPITCIYIHLSSIYIYSLYFWLFCILLTTITTHLYYKIIIHSFIHLVYKEKQNPGWMKEIKKKNFNEIEYHDFMISVSIFVSMCVCVSMSGL